jgi:hypothetical protein
MFRNNPGVRLAIYAVGLVVVGLLVLANGLNWIGDDVFGTAINIINTVGGILGVGAIGTAFSNLGRQKISGTFDISGGTPAEQLAQAAKNYAEQKAKDEAALDAVLQNIPGGREIADAITGAVFPDDAREVVTACGDALQ